MSRHQPQPVMPFTGSPFDLDGRDSGLFECDRDWQLRMRVVCAQSNRGCVLHFHSNDSGADRDDRLRKTVRPSLTDGTRYVILATDDKYALVGVRSGFGCSRISRRSVFDAEDDVLAALPRRAAQSPASPV